MSRWRRRSRSKGAAWGAAIREADLSSELAPRFAQPRQQATPEPGSSRRRPRMRLRLSVAAIVAVGLFAVLVGRLWNLQVLNGKRAGEVAERTTTRQVTTPAPRGAILAAGGQALAKDRFAWVVTLDAPPGAGGERVASAAVERRLVGLIAGLSLRQLRAELASKQYSPYQPVPVAIGVPASTVFYLDAHRSEFPGVDAVEEPVRLYPHDDLATQTLGYVRQITASELRKLARYGYGENSIVGQSGLEEEYERYLQGTPGVETEEVSPSGSVVRTVSSKPAHPGDSVVVNLSLPLEEAVSSDLSSEINALHASGLAAPEGAAVVLDPRNGHVLAIASYPSYNDNWWVSGMTNARYSSLTHNSGYPLNNWAVQGFSPPGSTFKLATATAALNDGLISPTSEIDDTGIFYLPGSAPLHDADNVPLGWVNVTTAIAASSDYFFYTLGERFWDARSLYGETPIQDVAHHYGFGVESGVDLPKDEVQVGWVDSPQVRRTLHAQAPRVYSDSWYLGDNVEMAFGQGETVVTPIEEATAYATFANGGTRYAPELANRIVAPDGRVVRRIVPKVEAHVSMSASTRSALLAGFQGAVQASDGTAYDDFVGFDFSNWNLAGKTGTATVTVNDVKQPTSWFVAFGGPKGGPARYVVCVEINQAGYGASAAAPVVRQVYNYLHAHPTAGR